MSIKEFQQRLEEISPNLYLNTFEDKELLGRGVADYRWGVTDDITYVLVNKITDLLEKENLRYTIIESFKDVFSFELTDYYRGYVYFKVDLVEFTISQSYIAGIGHVTDQEGQKYHFHCEY